MPSITKHLIHEGCTFYNQMYPPLVFVVHRTAGHVNVAQLYDYWQATCISSHFGISYDGYGYDPGDIWQFVELWNGSGANCCPESGHHPFFDRGGNANTYTISVEVCTPNTNNEGLMTPAQVEALVYLIQSVCAELGIPTNQYSEYWNDYETAHSWIGPDGGIGMHRDVSPHNKRMCPGDPYYQGQMDEIIKLVNGGNIPGGESEMFNQLLTLQQRFSMTIPNTGGIWLAAIDGKATIQTQYKHHETGAWTGGSYTIDSEGNSPLLVARSQDSDITQLRLYFTDEVRKYPDTAVIASMTFDPTT